MFDKVAINHERETERERSMIKLAQSEMWNFFYRDFLFLNCEFNNPKKLILLLYILFATHTHTRERERERERFLSYFYHFFFWPAHPTEMKS